MSVKLRWKLMENAANEAWDFWAYSNAFQSFVSGLNCCTFSPASRCCRASCLYSPCLPSLSPSFSLPLSFSHCGCFVICFKWILFVCRRWGTWQMWWAHKEEDASFIQLSALLCYSHPSALSLSFSALDILPLYVSARCLLLEIEYTTWCTALSLLPGNPPAPSLPHYLYLYLCLSPSISHCLFSLSLSLSLPIAALALIIVIRKFSGSAELAFKTFQLFQFSHSVRLPVGLSVRPVCLSAHQPFCLSRCLCLASTF